MNFTRRDKWSLGVNLITKSQSKYQSKQRESKSKQTDPIWFVIIKAISKLIQTIARVILTDFILNIS